MVKMDSEVSEKKYVERVFLFGEIRGRDPFSYDFPPEFSRIQDRITMVVGIYKELRGTKLKVEIDGYEAGIGTDSGSIAVRCELPSSIYPSDIECHYHDIWREYVDQKHHNNDCARYKREAREHGRKTPEEYTKEISQEIIEQSKENLRRIVREMFGNNQKVLIEQVAELFPLIERHISYGGLHWNRKLGVIAGPPEGGGIMNRLFPTERLNCTLDELVSQFL
jgi:hypothetical protein